MFDSYADSFADVAFSGGEYIPMTEAREGQLVTGVEIAGAQHTGKVLDGTFVTVDGFEIDLEDMIGWMPL